MPKYAQANAISSPTVKVNGIGIPNIFYRSISSRTKVVVSGISANMSWRPIIILHVSVAPIYIPPGILTTVWWKSVKCFLYSIT